ncbi:hypothetical protein EBU95_19635 [bacterium]|nr:hypothetical protein [bacterium]
MPKLSLWKEGSRTNDYRFIDRRISEMFTISGTGVLLHKYLGPAAQGDTGDATQPNYQNQSERNIQDLLFLENRDRIYDTSVYKLRGMYQVSDSAFDLTQFGLFLQTGTLFISFHMNDMTEVLGRRIMNGDVIELQHLIDYETLDPDLPTSLKRFFVVSDCQRSAEGYSPTWWPHLWRCKINPLVDSQEYKDILNRVNVTTNYDGTETELNTTMRDLISTFSRLSDANDAIIEQAEVELPESGYNIENLFTFDRDNVAKPDFKINGYMTGSGVPPNGLPATSGIAFPANANEGDYCLRTDYLPNRLFRFNGNRWVKIEDDVRTNITNNATNNLTKRNSFITNNKTFVDVRGQVQPEKQNLNDILKPKAD